YAFGIEARADPRATITFDVVGRQLFHGGRYGYKNVTLARGVTGEALSELSEGLNVVSVAPGVKWNVGSTVLLTKSLLTAVANQGVRANITPVVGFEWAF